MLYKNISMIALLQLATHERVHRIIFTSIGNHISHLANLLVMKTTEHVNYLDGWRGLAIALVLESHFVGLLPVAAGRFGVDVFFCLSGFLMSGLLFIQRQSLVTFYKRRVSRIMPAFFAFVITVYLFA